jgi:glycerol-3-phosphate acyltransferase PlsY
VVSHGTTRALLAGWAAASIPFSNIAAHATRGVDLREHGGGTVSGTGLFEVAGFGPLAVAGVFEVAKGAVGPALARRDGARAVALAAAAAVCGHNWSPWLRGAGGRGLSPAIGALLVAAPAGAGVLLGGMAVGRIAGETAVGVLVADALLVPVVARVHGRDAALAAVGVVAPMIVKRLVGNRSLPPTGRARVVWNRLLLDRDAA